MHARLLYQYMDTTDVNKFLARFASPAMSCTVYNNIKIEGRSFAIIDIPEFPEIPIKCVNNCGPSEGKLVLEAGRTYIRTEKGESTFIQPSNEGNTLIDSVIEKIRGHKILDENIANYDNELKEEKEDLQAGGFNQFQNMGTLGHMILRAFPCIAHKIRLGDFSDFELWAKELSRRYCITQFPLIDSDNFHSRSDGIYTFSIDCRTNEAFLVFKSGQIYWQGVLRGDLVGAEDRFILNHNAYWITAMFHFLSVFYGRYVPETDIYVSLSLNNIKGRKMVPGEGIYVHDTRKWQCTKNDINLFGNKLSYNVMLPI